MKFIKPKSTDFYLTKMTYLYLYGPTFDYKKTIKHLIMKKNIQKIENKTNYNTKK